MSELRWNPVLEEWVVTAAHRQERTFLPSADYCPLCPTLPGAFPTEIPAADYDIVVFENRFPTFQRGAPEPAVEGTDLFPVRPASGICEVVCYTAQHDLTLSDLPVEEIRRLIEVWTDRYKELGALAEVDYVYIFENKGQPVGVTLTHPHGQIYAFPFIPPLLQKELDAAARYADRNGYCLFCRMIEEELRGGRRLVWENDSFLAVVPFFARYPYEVHILARAHKLSLSDFGVTEQLDLAAILKTVLTKYDGLWGFSLPYMMAMHQKPTDGVPHGSYHFHIEFYPLHRSRDKLKHLAGCESGAGTFVTDTLPEETAAQLRTVPVP